MEFQSHALKFDAHIGELELIFIVTLSGPYGKLKLVGDLCCENIQIRDQEYGLEVIL